ncbi:hypothetical protein F2Q68_00022105 [Brassica cretica]|uniref:Uncharacterized protein n=1 Tax=Brassica cretica TaxID=69181 RepID=A0A8S9FTX8_BRACR|nr:hypothetical protein F2Q68_00022105 [Brassica cretica]
MQAAPSPPQAFKTAAPLLQSRLSSDGKPRRQSSDKATVDGCLVGALKRKR